MNKLKRPKISVKCDCGQAVVPGSVFCPFCKDAVQKDNAKLIIKEEMVYQDRVRGKA